MIHSEIYYKPGDQTPRLTMPCSVVPSVEFTASDRNRVPLLVALEGARITFGKHFGSDALTDYRGYLIR